MRLEGLRFFEGPTLTVCPNGKSLRAWSREVGMASMPRPSRAAS